MTAKGGGRPPWPAGKESMASGYTDNSTGLSEDMLILGYPYFFVNETQGETPPGTGLPPPF